MRMSIQTNVKILIGGSFNSYNGTDAYFVVRLNSNSSLDNTFSGNLSAFLDDSVYSFTVQDDGKAIIGLGSGTVRVNTDVSLDTVFDSNVGEVKAIVMQPDGKILVSASYISVNGKYINSVGRLNQDGSIDDQFLVLANNVTDMLIQSDGKLLVAGDFSNYGDVYRGGILRLNTDIVFAKIDNNQCTNVNIISSTQLTCAVPAGTVGAKDVTITNSLGSETLTAGYTYNPSMSISSITPNNGPLAGGNEITVNGGGFSAGTTLTIGGNSCTNVIIVSIVLHQLEL